MPKSASNIKSHKKIPNDPTYGHVTDMLDEPGVIVEPDVRAKISDYFKKMLLRETIIEMIKTN